MRKCTTPPSTWAVETCHRGRTNIEASHKITDLHSSVMNALCVSELETDVILLLG